ncbi:hypothetical protein B0A49_05019 [Cryomyces minteri]|uniref:Uncharacterized protein n=1 Tax=Cryomyces minteri TaxID=331657 RepID=A0A4U0X672_9PEZI|nr:hypothetical protein B0A49_05019 [Cryomyces minteri]
MGRLVKLVGSGIGLASEALAARRAPTSPEASSSTRDPIDLPPAYIEEDYSPTRADTKNSYAQSAPIEHEDSFSDSSTDENEADWELDEAADALESKKTSASKRDLTGAVDIPHLIESFIAEHPAPSATARLPCPVIIPQRRPRNKKRGFVRAYAPVLAECDIDSATFMSFLKLFHQASKSSPVLDVIFISAGIAGLAPSAIAMITSAIVQLAAGTARELQARQRTNTFLSLVNEAFFRPRGLFAFVMTYKPDAARAVSGGPVDVREMVAKYGGEDGHGEGTGKGGMRDTMRGLRVSSGTTAGEVEMPDAAPLVFPALDAADTEEVKGMKKTQKFVAAYLDKRAQATYAAQNPTSSLTVSRAESEQFASRYSDPTHPATNGSLLSLVTGGALNPQARRQEKRDRKRARREGWRGQQRLGGQPVRGRGEKKGVRKMLQQNVLYLMIVNMPSEEEIAEARRKMEAA